MSEIDENIKIGSSVVSSWHPYDKRIICEVDRIYDRGVHKGIYCRLVYQYKGETRTCNVPLSYCSLDIAEERNKKLIELFRWK